MKDQYKTKKQLIDELVEVRRRFAEVESQGAGARPKDDLKEILVSIIEEAPDLVSAASPDGKVFFFNRTARETLGVSENDDLSRWSFPPGHPGWASEILRMEGIPTAIRDGRWTGRTAIIDRHGSEIPVSQTIISHKATDGSIKCLSSIIRNMGGLDGAEESRRILEALMAYVPEGISIATGPEGTVSMISRYGKEILGEWASQVEGHRGEDYAENVGIFRANGKQRARFDDLPLARAVKKGETLLNEEMVLRRPDGEEITMLCNAGPIRDGQGRITGGIVAWRDITERKAILMELRRARDELELRIQERTAELTDLNRTLKAEIVERKEAEKALREAKERLDRIFSTTHLCNAYMDRDFNLIHVNHAYEKADGRPESFLIGKNHFDLYPHPENEAIFRRVVETGEPYTAYAKAFEYPNSPQRGTTYWDWTLYPLKDDAGEVEGVLLCLADVTERIKAEKQLRESAKRLRDLSTALLSAHEEERKFVAGEIHDSIGSSLAAIKFRLEEKLASMDKDPPGEGVSLEQIIAMVKETIKESRRISSNLRPSILDNMGLLSTITWYCRQYNEFQPHLKVETSTDVQEEEVPEPLKIVIFRILQEGLNNVAKHAGADLVRVALTKMEDRLRLTIEDNGVGFDPARLIERPDATRGMGLSSMKDRTELHGGAFSIFSLEGKGTRVEALWPLS